MDYLTKPISRRILRKYAYFIREVFNVPQTGPFPVLEALEKIQLISKTSNYSILNDSCFKEREMARSVLNEDGGFDIEIRESVYKSAY